MMANAKPPECNSISKTERAQVEIAKAGKSLGSPEVTG